jgi:hypothetical protein
LQCSPSSSGCTHLSSAARVASLLNLCAAAIVCSELQDNRIVGTLEPLGSLRRLRYLCALPIDTMVALVCSRSREELCSDSAWLRRCEDLRSMRICVQRRQPESHPRRTRSTLRTYDAHANVPTAWLADSRLLPPISDDSLRAERLRITKSRARSTPSRRCAN